MPIGVLINVAAVACGTLVGVFIGKWISERFRETAVSVLGCVTMVLGIGMALKSQSILLMLISLLLGAAIGEWLNIQEALQCFGKWIEARVSTPASNTNPKKANIAQAFVTASIIFIVGPMTVVGSIQDGLRGDYSLIATKSLLDLIASMTLAVTMGWGVGLAALSIFMIQGGITYVAMALGSGTAESIAQATVLIKGNAHPLGTIMLDEMAAAGGILMIGTGLLLLDIKKIRIANLLPAIVIAPAAVYIFSKLQWPIAP